MLPSINPASFAIEAGSSSHPDDMPDIKGELSKKTIKPQKFNKTIKVEPIKSDRDSEWLRPIQREYILPGPGLFYIAGTTGSGKSVMVANLLSKKSMLKNYWKNNDIYLFCLSPCPMLEDAVGMPKKNVIHEDKPELLEKIVMDQKKSIENKGWSKTPRKLILIDDVAQSATFLKSKVLTMLAFAATHYRVSVWITSQSYVQLPRRIRINAHYIAIFHGCKRSEINRILDEYESAFMSKKQMEDLIKHATAEQYSFLYISNVVPDKHIQFRKGFDTILRIK